MAREIPELSWYLLRPYSQLEYIFLVSLAMGAWYPFAAGALGLGFLTSDEQSFTRGTGEQ